jgi:hypothetical protein
MIKSVGINCVHGRKKEGIARAVAGTDLKYLSDWASTQFPCKTSILTCASLDSTNAVQYNSKERVSNKRRHHHSGSWT